MSSGNTIDAATPNRQLRLWPGVVIVTVQWFVWLVVPLIVHDGAIGLLGAVAGGAALLIWWLLFSRASWLDRLGAIVLMGLAVAVARRLVHESIAGAGMGMLIYLWAIPGLSLALVLWAVATRHLGDGARRASLAAAVAIGCAPLAIVRTAGIVGGTSAEIHWRWTPTPEQRLLARGDDESKPPASIKTIEPGEPQPASPATTPAAAVHVPAPPRVERDAEWPGFRGPRRDGVVRGVRIDTDWAQKPPVEAWRRPIGPGWSSFAVQGDVFYTQEQRGPDEIVAAYKVSTGESVWRHRDAVRFWESNGGAGPRATPTISKGRVYTFGATGILNALDARSGTLLWARHVAEQLGMKVPEWGFASSPLVVDDVVVVAVSGTLAAYDANSGMPRWSGPKHGGSYSSPQGAVFDGVRQILLLNGSGVTSLAPATGATLWEQRSPGTAIVQPALTEDGVVVSSASAMGGEGTRRLSVEHGPDGWHATERWTSTGLKPYYNDFVVHNGYAYGFDGNILACIDLVDGTRKWKGGRYGNGQLMLFADQDVLLVVSEEGELALVSATSDKFTELARVPALNGKTWNHPALVGDVLLVRNGEEMAAFRLTLASH